ncbi:Frizzled-5 [Schistosoma japonicum]|uniref:Frizzled-5 n=1 Tax=Schistosoma japonicum TaxID=6182 RepID=A0A4Z2DQU5_SCHJA|nr:Frizzled-5 [Schistosoma japonicum]
MWIILFLLKIYILLITCNYVNSDNHQLNHVDQIIRIKRMKLHNQESSNTLDTTKLVNIPMTTNMKKQTISSIYDQSSSNQLLSNSIDNDKLLRPEKCIPIEIPLCKNIGYNLTYMPNAFNHETQEEAGLEVHQFYPLVEINCSEDLRLFLCSMYTPICLPTWHYRLTACKSLCESARDGCMPVMRTYGFGWPERMNCDLLPEGNECVSRSNTPTNHKTTTTSSSFNKDNTINMNNNHINQLNDVIIENNQSIEHDLFTVIHQMNSNNHLYPSDLLQSTTNQLHMICLPCKCRDPFLNWMKPPLNEVITGGITGCLLSCYSPTFNNQSDKTFVTFWLGLWSVLCILSTLITVITFLADPNRFQYPERPIIYLSACYFMIALGYLLRVSLGHETVACDGSMLRISTTGPVQCSIVFLLTYVFGMASSVWWVILTLTWFLAAGLKWGTEAIAKYSQGYLSFIIAYDCYHFK